MIANRLTAFMSPKLDARPRPHQGGVGVFAHAPVQAGELLIVWGGDVVPGEMLPDLPPLTRQHSIQIEENMYLVPSRSPEPADYVNHCCEPNSGLSGQISLVALREIAPDEEICFDYAMCDGSPYDEFTCTCGAPTCRGRVSGDDWKRPELWDRYEGHFSPYLQRRINRLREVAPAEWQNGRVKVLAANGKSV